MISIIISKLHPLVQLSVIQSLLWSVNGRLWNQAKAIYKEIEDKKRFYGTTNLAGGTYQNPRAAALNDDDSMNDLLAAADELGTRTKSIDERAIEDQHAIDKAQERRTDTEAAFAHANGFDAPSNPAAEMEKWKTMRLLLIDEYTSLCGVCSRKVRDQSLEAYAIATESKDSNRTFTPNMEKVYSTIRAMRAMGAEMTEAEVIAIQKKNAEANRRIFEGNFPEVIGIADSFHTLYDRTVKDADGNDMPAAWTLDAVFEDALTQCERLQIINTIYVKLRSLGDKNNASGFLSGNWGRDFEHIAITTAALVKKLPLVADKFYDGNDPEYLVRTSYNGDFPVVKALLDLEKSKLPNRQPAAPLASIAGNRTVVSRAAPINDTERTAMAAAFLAASQELNT